MSKTKSELLAEQIELSHEIEELSSTANLITNQLIGLTGQVCATSAELGRMSIQLEKAIKALAAIPASLRVAELEEGRTKHE